MPWESRFIKRVPKEFVERVGRFPGEEVIVSLIPEVKIMVYKDRDKLCEYHL